MEDMLPENVMFDVISRLPVKTIIYCKCVCKRWRGLVADPYFVHLHLSRSREQALMILEFSGIDSRTLKWVEIEHEHLATVKSLNLTRCEPLPPIATRSLLFSIGCVNGLVSLGDTNDSFYIFNPMLEEYMTLPPPPPPPPQPPQCRVMAGYGFGVLTAGEYKVIKIFINLSETPEWAVETVVYTLGTNQWRSLRQTPNSLNLGSIQSRGVYLNSHLYWLVDHAQIYDFDLSMEISELVPYPPVSGDNQESGRTLGVLKGRLCYISWCSSGGVDVWVMKEESNWYKEITVIKPSIKLDPWRHDCLIDDLDGTIVLWGYMRRADKLVAYCLNTNMILSGTSILWTDLSSTMSYRPSFVKLDKFGLERVHAIYNHNP